MHIYTYIHVRTHTHIHIYTHTRTKCIYERTQARLERRRGSERARSCCRRRKLCTFLSFDAIKAHFAPPMQGLHCTYVGSMKNNQPAQAAHHANHDSAAPRQHPLICTGAEPIHQVHGQPTSRAPESMLRNRITFPPFSRRFVFFDGHKCVRVHAQGRACVPRGSPRMLCGASRTHPCHAWSHHARTTRALLHFLLQQHGCQALPHKFCEARGAASASNCAASRDCRIGAGDTRKNEVHGPIARGRSNVQVDGRTHADRGVALSGGRGVVFQ